jgi:hypothetical protein
MIPDLPFVAPKVAGSSPVSHPLKPPANSEESEIWGDVARPMYTSSTPGDVNSKIGCEGKSDRETF